MDLFETGIAGADWVRYGEPRYRGYSVITITPSEMTADFRVVATALEQTSTVRTDFTDVVPDRDPVVLPVDTPTTTTSTPTDDGDATPATPVPGSASYTG